MNKYYAIGDYGPLGDQSISRNFWASSTEAVRIMFKGYVIRYYGEYTWSKMGYRNVSIYEGWME
jgi:hypothetical protein